MSLILESMELKIIPGHYMAIEKIDGSVNSLCCVFQNNQICMTPHAVTGFDANQNSVFVIPMTSIKHIRIYVDEKEIEQKRPKD